MVFSREIKHIIAIWIICWTCSKPVMSRNLNEVVAYDNEADQYRADLAESEYRAALAEAQSRLAFAEAQCRLAFAEAQYQLSVVEAHEKWMAKYGRTYANEAEKNKRYQIFKENLEYVEKSNNAGNQSYTLGLNQFADLTKEEFLTTYAGSPIASPPMGSEMSPSFSSQSNAYKMASSEALNQSEVPTSMDWRVKGAVTHIKDEDGCGVDYLRGDLDFAGVIHADIQANISRCALPIYLPILASSWSFSAVAAVEGLIKIKTGKLTQLSEQQLMDCACNDEQKHGYCGGSVDNAFKYIVKHQGLASEADYPYEGKGGTCHGEKAAKRLATIKGYVNIQPNSENQLVEAVTKQPVSAAIAVSSGFQLYSGGIYKGICGDSLNHWVTVVGYGSDDGNEYWLIKNSWGRSWGDDGYMQLQRDVSTSEGYSGCGIAMKASYPTA